MGINLNHKLLSRLQNHCKELFAGTICQKVKEVSVCWLISFAFISKVVECGGPMQEVLK
jgi:hypothetical protein